MKVPYDGNVRIELVLKRFKQKVLYVVGEHKNNILSIAPCLLASRSCLKMPMLRHFDTEMVLDKTCSRGASWESVFETIEDAEEELKNVKSLYFDGFAKKPFIRLPMLKERKEELAKIEKDIGRLLKFDPAFKYISFSDVSAGGIQINSDYAHKTIKYDFSNKNDVVIDFVDDWNNFKHTKANR